MEQQDNCPVTTAIEEEYLAVIGKLHQAIKEKAPGQPGTYIFGFQVLVQDRYSAANAVLAIIVEPQALYLIYHTDAIPHYRTCLYTEFDYTEKLQVLHILEGNNYHKADLNFEVTPDRDQIPKLTHETKSQHPPGQ